MSDLELVKPTTIIRSVSDLARVSKVFAESGYFKGTKDAAQAAVKILAGLEMGIGSFAAMSGMHVIEGKVEPGANLIASFFRRHPRYDYHIKSLTDTECGIVVLMDGEIIGESTFTAKDAQKAGLTNRQNWKSYPRNMLFARAISNAHRFYAPDLFGGAPAYVEGELEASDVVPTIPDFIDAEKIEASVASDSEATTTIDETPNQEPEVIAKTWRNADDALLWAADLRAPDGSPLFRHPEHARNAYEKAKREYLNSLPPEDQPSDSSSREVKVFHFRALNRYWVVRCLSRTRGEEYVLPPHGSQQLFPPIGEGEALASGDLDEELAL